VRVNETANKMYALIIHLEHYLQKYPLKIDEDLLTKVRYIGREMESSLRQFEAYFKDSPHEEVFHRDPELVYALHESWKIRHNTLKDDISESKGSENHTLENRC